MNKLLGKLCWFFIGLSIPLNGKWGWVALGVGWAFWCAETFGASLRND